VGFDVVFASSIEQSAVPFGEETLGERNPALTPAAVRKILMQTAKPLGPKSRNRDFGAGLVNAFDAVRAAKPNIGQ
jgi:hypothetical protein